jgi:hypothetical protein
LFLPVFSHVIVHVRSVEADAALANPNELYLSLLPLAAQGLHIDP